MFLLAIWIVSKTGLSSLSLQLGEKTLSGSETLTQMAKAAMLIVAYFAALLLNFGDFSRFAKSERSMKVGNILGLPVNFCVFAIITVIVTAGTIPVFGKAIMDPVAIVEQIGNPIIAILGSITFIVATMGINIVANFVSPAYDIANLYPEKIDFRMGGLIASILAVLVCPWLFVSSAQAITIFVGIFGSVLGPMYGIMVADYYIIKRQTVILEDLYTLSPRGSLYFDSGWNPKAVLALGLSGVVSIGLSLLGAFGVIYNVGDWGWLIGSTLGAILYVAFARSKGPVGSIASTSA
jgi:NCS1 family nucleobase:cation symporter-1